MRRAVSLSRSQHVHILLPPSVLEARHRHYNLTGTWSFLLETLSHWLSSGTVEEKWVIRPKWRQQLSFCHRWWPLSERPYDNRAIRQHQRQREDKKNTVWLWDSVFVGVCFPSRFLVRVTCCHLCSLGQAWHCSWSMKAKLGKLFTSNIMKLNHFWNLTSLGKPDPLLIFKHTCSSSQRIGDIIQFLFPSVSPWFSGHFFFFFPPPL